ncbi:MAG TPA: fibronectin type III domain-containing protein [Candidatus Udaeobacter sp.]
MSYIRISAFICIVLGLAGVAGDHRLSGQTAAPAASPFEIGAARHETRAESQTSLELLNTNEFPSENETVSPPPPTRSSFMATWLGGTRAKGYLLDVSTSSSFDTFVEGYHDLDVGNVTGRVVTGLSRGTTYYYRVRAYDAAGAGNYSDVMTATTVSTVGLVIHPTFDGSITSNPNAAAIEAMISRAISFHESLFTDPITIQIRFRYSTTAPDGTPLSMRTLALTYILLYQIPWSNYIGALRADAMTSNDTQANASLPVTALSGNVRPSSAGGRAVGLNTPPSMFANGSVGQGGPYDAIVTLNSTAPYQFNRPPSASSFDAQRAIEHEVDEAIGLGSRLGGNGNDLRPQDLFSWSSPGDRNISTSGSRYFSINGGVTNIVNFNQNPDGDLGDWLSGQCPQTHPYVQNAFVCPGQYSDISATSPEGISLDVVGYDLIQTSQTSLGNISTRSFVQTGQHVMIGGFIVQGTGPKRVIIRAIGPELTQYGITNALANPRLELHNRTGALIASNDNWQTTILGGIITSNQVSDIQNSGHPPTAASESAIIANLQPGNYTAIVCGVNNTTGVALVEVYDLSPGASSSLGNISTRSFVQTGEHVMIGGFIVEGSGPKRVIIRAIGPELTQHGITDALANPRLELHNGTGALIATNDNWQATILGGIITSNQVSDIQNSGHPPTAASESAIIANLQPGNYTAIVRGVNNTAGVALVEVYDLN